MYLAAAVGEAIVEVAEAGGFGGAGAGIGGDAERPSAALPAHRVLGHLDLVEGSALLVHNAGAALTELASAGALIGAGAPLSRRRLGVFVADRGTAGGNQNQHQAGKPGKVA